jgi:hypothetical protein
VRKRKITEITAYIIFLSTINFIKKSKLRIAKQPAIDIRSCPCELMERE